MTVSKGQNDSTEEITAVRAVDAGYFYECWICPCDFGQLRATPGEAEADADAHITAAHSVDASLEVRRRG